jgi:hypothetical protein
MIKKLYIGCDPSIEKLNAVVISGDMKLQGVFFRRNKSKKSGDNKVSDAARYACALAEDVIKFIIGFGPALEPTCTVTTIIESQSMQDAVRRRKKGQKVDYDSIRKLAQVSGQLMGVFSNVSDKLVLVQPSIWKGTIDKTRAHPRYYRHLGLEPDIQRRVSCIYPTNMAEVCKHSQVKINMGDFYDINDSMGLALYGAKKGL